MSDELTHYGVKGMKWGVRNDSPEGVSPGTARDARKDAKEFARAKAFYGEGAGTRRKLIKQTVEGKSKRDPNYKKAFDHYLDKQDSSKHVDKARSERKRKDVVNKTAKTARGIRNAVYGNPELASTAAIALVAGYGAAKKAGIDKIVVDHAKSAYSTVRTAAADKQNMAYARQFLKDMGM